MQVKEPLDATCTLFAPACDAYQELETSVQVRKLKHVELSKDNLAEILQDYITRAIPFYEQFQVMKQENNIQVNGKMAAKMQLHATITVENEPTVEMIALATGIMLASDMVAIVLSMAVTNASTLPKWVNDLHDSFKYNK